VRQDQAGVVDDTIVQLSRIEARVEPYEWPFARERADDIAAHWGTISAGRSGMFDGRILLQHRVSIVGDVFHAGYFEASYSSFMTWRDFGHPGPIVRNGYAMAALRAADGAFLCGVMGSHTSNAGKVYFAAGTPDLNDVRPDGSLDLAGSATRELIEETGLTAGEFAVEERWTAVIMHGRIAFMRPVTLMLKAEEAQALLRSRIAEQAEPELADIVIVRGPADRDRYDMPPFMLRYLAHIWGED